MYRSRVRKVSPSYRSQSVVQLPEQHTPKSQSLRAEDGIRTRDPHLGKVMRYQLRYVRMPPETGDGWKL